MPEPLTFDDLVRFHHEIALPDVERILDSRLAVTNGRIDALRNEMFTHFDAVYARFDRLESEYQALRVAVERLEVRVGRLEERLAALEMRVGRLEEGMTAVEEKLDRMALRSEVAELEAQMVRLREKIAQLESARDAFQIADEATSGAEIDALKTEVALLRQRVEVLERRLGPSHC